jgi:exodeoxyribonuclease III
MHIVTWNINGLRSVTQKGFAKWFVKTAPDIIALQEIKSTHEDVSHILEEWAPHYDVHLHPAIRKGYSGVALMIRKESKDRPIKINTGIGLEHFDVEGRLISAEYKDFILLNGYFPNGKRDHSRVDYKLEFSREVLSLALKLKKKTKKAVIICGDLNTAHQEIDLANPKSNAKTTGFLPHERVFIDELIAAGFVDTYRDHYPDQKGAYTWWTYRGDCRERNIGWRLDYFFTDKDFIKNIKRVAHLSEISLSDHCPVEIVF